ncbi:hypothetical protein [Fibrivirga algicola]|uniref:Outer membrane protein beta-barrel domain-containing protein n=1 Tax=Fibrivirga algicola TaxID=2950420 RepID=A0ABX0QHV7_9BACT|nr:hypothetical protein [Fibrivirga algicola]NID12041.1 hypothetical protein [Fibrivirga algicola]
MRNRLTTLCLLGTLLSSAQQGMAQLTADPGPERRLVLGLDLSKTLIPALSGKGANFPFKHKSFFTIEPSLRIEMANKRFSWVLQPGFTRFTDAPFGNASLSMTGSFLKAGAEYRIATDHFLGLLLTTSGWQTEGTVTIPSPAFSPYQSALPTNRGVAGGLEFQSSQGIRLGPTSMFRFVVRINSFWRSRLRDSPETPYIPGLGRYGDLRGSSMSATFGASLEYHYYVRGRW